MLLDGSHTVWLPLEPLAAADTAKKISKTVTVDTPVVLAESDKKKEKKEKKKKDKKKKSKVKEAEAEVGGDCVTAGMAIALIRLCPIATSASVVPSLFFPCPV